jgi:glycosyltransferase involved in cell wall biosynthesis
MPPLLLDVSHTSHTRARTGIQRVVRSIHAELGANAAPITYDPYRRAWRPVQAWEVANLASTTPSRKRAAAWPATVRMAGRVARLFGRAKSSLPSNAGLIVPELFSADVGRTLRTLSTVVSGPRVAVFHDAIPLQLPELSAPKTVSRFPAYLRELVQFDGIAAVSDASRDALTEYWTWLGATNVPPVQTIPLGVSPPAAVETRAEATSSPPVVLCVGSIEGRKNHLALLAACEQLWTRGVAFELRLIGIAQPATGALALDQIRTLQAAGRPVRYDGPVGEDALGEAYNACAFTVYPSLKEGFGLPVLESVGRGKPCICSADGAVGESARGGGCLALERVDADSLAAAIAGLLGDRTRLTQLTIEARARKLRRWSEYVSDLTRWMKTLPRRAAQ